MRLIKTKKEKTIDLITATRAIWKILTVHRIPVVMGNRFIRFWQPHQVRKVHEVSVSLTNIIIWQIFSVISGCQISLCKCGLNGHEDDSSNPPSSSEHDDDTMDISISLCFDGSFDSTAFRRDDSISSSEIGSPSRTTKVNNDSTHFELLYSNIELNDSSPREILERVTFIMMLERLHVGCKQIT